MTGGIKCPDNFDDFCNNFPQKCQDNCNSKGICINQKCVCSQDYTGEACEKHCIGGGFNYKGSCVKKCPKGTAPHADSLECLPRKNKFNCTFNEIY